jgi:hypothetical protein
MKLSPLSYDIVKTTILNALDTYRTEDANNAELTDIYIKIQPENGGFRILDDEENNLGECSLDEWAERTDSNYINDMRRVVKQALTEINKDNPFEDLNIIKPYSFVMVDSDMNNIAELYLVDDNNVIVDEELMKGLDEELNDFLRELLDE